MPDKMSQYHWLKIKSIFQIYCTAGTWKAPALKCWVLAWCEFLCCAVGDPGCDGWGGGQGHALVADSAAMGLPVRVCPRWALCYKNNLSMTLITGHRTPPPPPSFYFLFSAEKHWFNTNRATSCCLPGPGTLPQQDWVVLVCYLKLISFFLFSCHLVGGGKITTVELFQLLLSISVTPSEELGLTRAVLHTNTAHNHWSSRPWWTKGGGADPSQAVDPHSHSSWFEEI